MKMSTQKNVPPTYMIKKQGSQISKYVISTEAGKPNQKGDEVQIMLGWKYTYKEKGWNKYATFDTKGRPNIVYGLFKLKNLLDPVTRKKKWSKLRPMYLTKYKTPNERLVA